MRTRLATCASILALAVIVGAPMSATAERARFLTLPFRSTKGMHIQRAWGMFDGYLHHGIDYIRGFPGSPSTWRGFTVLAAAPGFACAQRAGRRGCIELPDERLTNRVLIRHRVGGRTYYTLYQHLAKIAPGIPIGSRHRTIRVERGERIGKTGADEGPGSLIHLHFELLDAHLRPIDPYDIRRTSGFYPDPAGGNRIKAKAGHYWLDNPPRPPERDRYEPKPRRPSPTPTPDPTPTPSTLPSPSLAASPDPCASPAASGSPTASGSPSPSASGSPVPSVSGSASPPATPQPSCPPPPLASPAPDPLAYSHEPESVLLELAMTPGGANLGDGEDTVLFRLTGDGHVLYRPWNGGHLDLRAPPQEAWLDDARIRDLLVFALGRGGLPKARELYHFVTYGPAPSMVFAIHIPALDKRVVYQLPLGNLFHSDDPEVAGLQSLGHRLAEFTPPATPSPSSPAP
jgi:hypothetical protein